MKTKMRFPVLVILGGMLLAACGGTGETKMTSRLPRVEIQEYEGEDLSSVDSFRENSIKGPQTVSLDTYTLKVSGLVDNPLALTYEQVRTREAYTKVVTLHCVEGWDATILWEGILIDDLLKEAQAQESAVIAIFHAADGYTSSLPVAYLRDKQILLAYKMNGVDVPRERGFPFVVVAEAKWGYKWVKWVTEIELSNDPAYKGYWESFGYSNTGDLDEPFFGP
ncbi:MAG: molybdopterin-dependent oxidoreductase [Anaerolineales bacterium]|nr:molybdopterin-dependent oxidoreductase [Anaerolineales bacterium]